MSYRSPRMPPLSFQAPPPRRLAVRRHFKPNGPTALSPHSGSRAARFLNWPLWSRVLRCTASPRIAYGGALTAALLLSRYVSLSLGPFHCWTRRFCEGWRTAPRQRVWWLSYGNHGRFLGGGSGYPPV